MTVFCYQGEVDLRESTRRGPQEHRAVAQVRRDGNEEQAGEPREEHLGQGRDDLAACQPVLVQVHLHGGDAWQRRRYVSSMSLSIVRV